MPADLTPFSYGEHQVRVVLINDQPWWVVNDVCAALGISDPYSAVQRIDDRYLAQAQVTDDLGRLRSTNVVSEPGLYKLIFRSDKPEAVQFQNWTFEDVLPQIRKTGKYDEPLDELALAESYVMAIKARRLAETAVLQLEAEKSEIKAELDSFTDAEDLHSVRQVGNALGIGRNKLYQLLREHKIVFKESQKGIESGHRIYQRYLNAGWGTARWEASENGKRWTWVPYFTTRGVAGIRAKLLPED